MPPVRNTLMSIRLVVPASNATLPLPTTDQVVLGRVDTASGVFPDVDLTPYGGLESGVGRRHLRLSLWQGQVFAEDLNSTNGTFINGQRLAPQTQQALNNGDELRLGALALHIHL